MRFRYLLIVPIVVYGLLETGYRTGVALAPIEAFAQAPSTLTGGAAGAAYDHEVLSVTSGAATGFSPAKINPPRSTSAKMVEITIETQNIRYRYDGQGSPTTTTGHQIVAGTQRFVIGINNINQFRMIAETGTATVRATFLH